jgi:tetratricopeptide (TPR) repeat protein
LWQGGVGGIPVLGQAGGDAQSESANGLSARDQLNLGVDAYKAARYGEAIAHFRKATELDPSLPMAKVYLATALAQNVVPGLDTPENLTVAQQAIDLFKQILTNEPKDVNNLKQIAGICYSVKRFDEAKDWQKKVLDVDPVDSEAAYTIGVIDWTLAHQNALKALQSVGMTDDGTGNGSAPAVAMEAIKTQNGALVPEAIDYLNQAILNRANYDDAMAYMNLVYRRKADLDWGNEAARAEDVAKAEEWAKKAMAARKTHEQTKAAAGSPH